MRMFGSLQSAQMGRRVETSVVFPCASRIENQRAAVDSRPINQFKVEALKSLNTCVGNM